MASRSIITKSFIKPYIAHSPLKNNLNNNRASIFPATQASRQATTSSIAVDSSNTTHGDVPTFQLFDYSYKIKDIPLVKFTSVEGKRLFRNAMVQGHAESFFKLMGNFSTQSSPSHGGVSSSMVLNALEIDPKKIWKGNWRWFSSEQMKTCSPAKTIEEHGIPFDEFTCLAQTYCKVESYRGVRYQKFLTDLEAVTSDITSQMVVNYSRTALGQQSHYAHFSPIGGYNKVEDQVLIMDVARGKYPSVWVNTRDLYKAMLETSPEEAGRSRGYFILSNQEDATNKSQKIPSKLKCKDCSRKCHTKA